MIFYEASKADPLSQIIALLKPQAVASNTLEAHDSWCIRFPAIDFAAFGQLVEGECRVDLADGRRLQFQTGDFLLLSAPAAWTMSTSGDGRTVDLKPLLAEPRLLHSASPNPRKTKFIAGAFAFAAPNAGLLAALIPSVIHIRSAEIAHGSLCTLLRLLGEEAQATRPGKSLVLNRLLEIILVEILRYRPGDLGGQRRSLLAGLEDAQIGAALRMMHEDCTRAWTVAALAREVGMSRSAFAARFAALVGASPIEYLLNWRLNLAKAALTSSKKPMSDIAELAGYQSVSAFSTAFSRATGSSPSAYARALR